MKLARFAWAAWAMVPVAALSFHYGPGQKIYRQDMAARLQETARRLEKEAADLQSQAYAKHLEAIQARRKSFVEGTPESEAAANKATDAENAAFLLSSEAWKSAANAFGQIQDVAQDATAQTLQKIRWSRSRALVRAGDIWSGIGELETVLDEIEGTDKLDAAGTEMARATREELASAYYYGARLMRLAGEPEEEWRIDSGKARQHFRFLAENARVKGLSKDVAENHERNVELVLDLEQSSVMELQGKALPKESPLRRAGPRPGRGEGKRKQPPQQRDGRGAGGAEEIFSGW
jgi:hypothetical protein